jgi:hypothetical protein
MVGRVLVSLTGLLSAGLLLFGACRSVVEFAPVLSPGDVPDADQVVKTIPGSGYVNISKNGYRVFDLDAIVSDSDDVDTDIGWSFSPGPGLEVRLQGDSALIGPLPNQVCTSYVVFTATDPIGKSSSKTCAIMVFDEFSVAPGADTLSVKRHDSTSISLACHYRPSLQSLLTWGDAVLSDTVKLKSCSLSGSPANGRITVHAGSDSCMAAVQFSVNDPVNHVDFVHSIPVVVR